MRVNIRLIKQLGNGQKHVMVISGELDVVSDVADTDKMTAQTMFEIEYAINEYMPRIRAHIEVVE
jgi:hypothetical protein